MTAVYTRPLKEGQKEFTSLKLFTDTQGGLKRGEKGSGPSFQLQQQHKTITTAENIKLG